MGGRVICWNAGVVLYLEVEKSLKEYDLFSGGSGSELDTGMVAVMSGEGICRQVVSGMWL